MANLFGQSFRLHCEYTPTSCMAFDNGYDQAKFSPIVTVQEPTEEAEWFIKDVEGEWFRIASKMHPDLWMSPKDDESYGKIAALNDDLSEHSLWRIVAHEGNYMFESKTNKGQYLHCVGGDAYDTTDVILAEHTENNSRFIVQKLS